MKDNVFTKHISAGIPQLYKTVEFFWGFINREVILAIKN